MVRRNDDLRKDFEILRQRGVIFEESEPVDYPFGVRIEAGVEERRNSHWRREGS
ncbi:hypothetical protein GCM10023075_82680 [Streptosporangium album]